MEKTFFDGRYVYVNTLGQGGMGTVYLVKNRQLGNLWAIKAVDKQAAGGVDFLAEPNILKKLSHPALPRIVDIGEDQRYLYIVEDFIDGYSLDVQMNLVHRFPESQVVHWAKQLCEVLAYLHSQKPSPVIYRDMKPANLIVDSNNRIKLIDFGIAREYKANSTQDTSYVGTRGYAAPEQYGVGQTDERTDIYSLGVTLYHLLTGLSPNEPPYQVQPLRQVDPKLSEGMEHIVAKCTQPDPAKRYQSVAELHMDLKHYKRLGRAYKRFRRVRAIKRIAKSLLVAASCLCIVYGVRLIRADRQQAFTAAIDSGYRMIEEFRYEDAMELFQQAIKQNGSNSAGHLGVSNVLIKQGEYERCVSYLKDNASLFSGDSAAGLNRNLGYCYMELDDTGNAVFYMEKAVELDGSNVEWLTDLAVCYALQKEYDKALDVIQDIDSENPAVDFIKGQVLLSQGERGEARQLLRLTAAQSEDDSLRMRAYTTLASSYDTQGTELRQRIAVLEQARRELPEYGDFQIVEMLGESYHLDGQPESAAQMFQLLLDRGYNRAYIYRNLAIIRQEQGDLQEARRILEQMRAQFETDYTCYMQLAYLQLEIENQKAQNKRDFGAVWEYYQLAVGYSPQGEATPELLPLKNMMDELREKNWL